MDVQTINPINNLLVESYDEMTPAAVAVQFQLPIKLSNFGRKRLSASVQHFAIRWRR